LWAKYAILRIESLENSFIEDLSTGCQQIDLMLSENSVIYWEQIRSKRKMVTKI
jgi:hypothetical protein